MITAVTTCMGRLEHLEITLPMMLAEFDEVIVVDWSCPDWSGNWAAKEGAKVVYKKGQEFFNASRARNLGARAATGRSVCFIDADCMVMPGTRNEIEKLLDLSSMVVAARTSDETDVASLFGFIALDIGIFWGAKGYDESIEGYGLEDCRLRAKLCLEKGLKVKRLSAGALGAIRHDNSLRMRFHKEKSIEVSRRENMRALQDYLKAHGVSDWVSDPLTADIAYREPQ